MRGLVALLALWTASAAVPDAGPPSDGARKALVPPRALTAEEDAAMAKSTAVCPVAVPREGSGCSRLQFDTPARCLYPNAPRCPFAYCAELGGQYTWHLAMDHCAIDCPATLPDAGAPCAPITWQSCEYRGGHCGLMAHCGEWGWAIVGKPPCGGEK